MQHLLRALPAMQYHPAADASAIAEAVRRHRWLNPNEVTSGGYVTFDGEYHFIVEQIDPDTDKPVAGPPLVDMTLWQWVVFLPGQVLEVTSGDGYHVAH